MERVVRRSGYNLATNEDYLRLFTERYGQYLKAEAMDPSRARFAEFLPPPDPFFVFCIVSILMCFCVLFILRFSATPPPLPESPPAPQDTGEHDEIERSFAPRNDITPGSFDIPTD